MGTSPYFIFYPLFRLTIWLAIGIFLFATYGAGRISWEYLAAAFGISVLFSALFYRTCGYRYRLVFGFLTVLTFILLGGTLVLVKHSLVHHVWDGRELVYCGVVETVPQVKGKTLQAEVRLSWAKNPKDSLHVQPLRHSILFYWMPDSLSLPLCCGDSVCFYGRVEHPSLKTPRFNYSEYLERKGISGTAVAYAGNWVRIENSRSLTLRQKASLLQQQITDVYRSRGLEGKVLAVVSALTIGDKSELTPELKNVYNAAGASHILALSGLHVGILVALFMGLCYPLCYFRAGKRLVLVVAVIVLWGFAFVSGLSPSVIRAVTMFSLYVMASFFTEERFSGFLALTLTAFLMLIYQPYYLFDVSFQLSFVAVLSILFLYPVVSSLCPFQNSFVRYVWNVLGISLVAQLGTMPFVFYYFGTFPTYFLLANLFVSPLAFCIIGSALLAFVFSAFPFIGNWGFEIVAFFAGLMNTIMERVEQLGGSQITSLYISSFQVFTLYAAILLLYVYVIRRRPKILIAFLVMLNLFALGGLLT